MSILQEQIAATLCPKMEIPSPLAKLFDWIESSGFYLDRDGKRYGVLYPDDKLQSEWKVAEREGGTLVTFFAEGNIHVQQWLGREDPSAVNRLCAFAQTGGDGSMAAFWLDDAGNQKIVHLGSGSESMLTCVLADDAVDFLRLLAIGYDEICWIEAFDLPPNSPEQNQSLIVHPNGEYQDWVRKTFSVDIPKTAAEIVEHPAEMGDTETLDPFCCWVERNTG